MAEAQFGLRNFDEAKKWLDAAGRAEIEAEWEFESTARQLTDLAKLLEFEGTKSAEDFAATDAGKALITFLGDSVAGLKTAYIGKVGSLFPVAAFVLPCSILASWRGLPSSMYCDTSKSFPASPAVQLSAPIITSNFAIY